MIKLLVMDVDGTMTDGKIYIGNNGEIFKSFSVKDGYAIAELLPNSHVKTAVITGRNSDIVAIRANELKIDYVCQGVKRKKEKLNVLAKQMRVCMEEIAYIGDDFPDLECIKICGFTACPADAIIEIKNSVNYVCKSNSGNGAIREFAEKIIDYNKKENDNKVFD